MLALEITVSNPKMLVVTSCDVGVGGDDGDGDDAADNRYSATSASDWWATAEEIWARCNGGSMKIYRSCGMFLCVKLSLSG